MLRLLMFLAELPCLLFLHVLDVHAGAYTIEVVRAVLMAIEIIVVHRRGCCDSKILLGLL
jgi:hypothetical protein